MNAVNSGQTASSGEALPLSSASTPTGGDNPLTHSMHDVVASYPDMVTLRGALRGWLASLEDHEDRTPAAHQDSDSNLFAAFEDRENRLLHKFDTKRSADFYELLSDFLALSLMLHFKAPGQPSPTDAAVLEAARQAAADHNRETSALKNTRTALLSLKSTQLQLLLDRGFNQPVTPELTALNSGEELGYPSTGLQPAKPCRN